MNSFAKSMKVNSSTTATVHIYDHAHNEDIHDLSAQVNDTSGPHTVNCASVSGNVFAITTGSTEGQASIVFTDVDTSTVVGQLDITVEDRDIVDVDITFA